ncbi:TdeIII family type II restriction endonuclease [Olivibacter sp. LS-1]|uniref:TdeIII family type II restriction endonuclease n=1 Tax=Olivibacter sp. LS-1 TaxID=2592345 RepID=UPI0011EADC94|nr:TdeIII family type II restriction endonuclease [Olivibacter sp. LS-1]QEK99463.1 TdeIII family type II restriction endonuclease [Olivibacter sp. LS-1]
MPTRNEIYIIVRQTVINSITGFIRNRKNVAPKFQILDLIIPTERKIRSIVGGMETSLGTTLWEPLAKALARENGFEVINENLLCPSNMPAILENTVNLLIDGRNNRNPLYDAKYCHDRIREVSQNFLINPINDFKLPPNGFGVDVWLRKDDVNYFFDTKTVQANVGTYAKFLSQVLNWYAYFYSKYPTGRASARIVFPYNPYGEVNFWQRTIGRGWPLEPTNEGWVKDEFWDFCSGIDDTYSIIQEAFANISQTGDLEDIIQEIFYGREL